MGPERAAVRPGPAAMVLARQRRDHHLQVQHQQRVKGERRHGKVPGMRKTALTLWSCDRRKWYSSEHHS